MRTKDSNNDSGKYVNGIYTTKNGFSGLGLNCPKGTRLYNTEVVSPIFFMPEDRGETEDFEMLTQNVCEGIMPYYAISNYGRVLNVNSGKIMKENFRPNGYSYYCLAAEDCKHGQRKYNTNRMVLKTFDPREDADQLQVNHINGIKSENYVNKTMEDGTIQSNLEWKTPSENIRHAYDTGLKPKAGIRLLTEEDAKHIRELKNQGYSYSKIGELYPNVSGTTIQFVCKNVIYTDPNYIPEKDYGKSSYADNTNNNLKLSDKDAEMIRKLFNDGYNYVTIRDKFYPHVSVCTISDIVRRKTHNRT